MQRPRGSDFGKQAPRALRNPICSRAVAKYSLIGPSRSANGPIARADAQRTRGRGRSDKGAMLRGRARHRAGRSGADSRDPAAVYASHHTHTQTRTPDRSVKWKPSRPVRVRVSSRKQYFSVRPADVSPIALCFVSCFSHDHVSVYMYDCVIIRRTGSVQRSVIACCMFAVSRPTSGQDGS